MESLEYLKSRREYLLKELARPPDHPARYDPLMIELDEKASIWLKDQLLSVDARIADLTSEPVQGWPPTW
jgi:hypothetical protein